MNTIPETLFRMRRDYFQANGRYAREPFFTIVFSPSGFRQFKADLDQHHMIEFTAGNRNSPQTFLGATIAVVHGQVEDFRVIER